MMILGHWKKEKTPKASGKNDGENIKENNIKTKGKARQRQQDPGDPDGTRNNFSSFKVSAGPREACGLEGGCGSECS